MFLIFSDHTNINLINPSTLFIWTVTYLIVFKKSNIIKSQPDPVLKTMTRKGKSLTWFLYPKKSLLVTDTSCQYGWNGNPKIKNV